MLSEEMVIKKMLVESGDSDSNLYIDSMKCIAQINDDINALATAFLNSEYIGIGWILFVAFHYNRV